MPVWKAALALSLAPMLASTTGPITPAGPRELYTHIVQVDCDTSRGTAFQIADGRYLTAAHVSHNTGCTINGAPIEAVEEAGLDFAVLKAGPGHGFPVNCGGFRTGTYVFGIGFAHGWPWQTMNRMFVTFKDTTDGMRYLLGPSVIPGMSGGPILNAEGEVVGIVNRYTPDAPLSYSRPLRDTSVCKKS